MMDVNTIKMWAEAALEVMGGLYLAATAVGSIAPNTKVGAFCCKFAADLRKAQQDIAPFAGRSATGQLPGSGDTVVTNTTGSPTKPSA